MRGLLFVQFSWSKQLICFSRFSKSTTALWYSVKCCKGWENDVRYGQSIVDSGRFCVCETAIPCEEEK